MHTNTNTNSISMSTSIATCAMESAAARDVFNLNVLRRHDASIAAVVDSASFVVLYNYSGEWVSLPPLPPFPPLAGFD